MGDTLAPDTANYIRGGAQILFKRSGSSGGYTDLGNLPDFALATLAQYLEHKTSRSGKIVVDRREQTEAGLQLKMSKDELNAANLSMILNADAASAFSQSSATGNTMSITNPVLGDKYELGAFRVSAVVAKRATTVTLTAGTDYSLEADVGTFRPLPGGAILINDTVDITYTKPAITGNQVNPLSNSGILRGAILVYIRASDGRIWRFKHTLATLGYEGDLSLTGGEFAKANGTVTIEPDYSKDEDNGRFGELVLLPAA